MKARGSGSGIAALPRIRPDGDGLKIGRVLESDGRLRFRPGVVSGCRVWLGRPAGPDQLNGCSSSS